MTMIRLRVQSACVPTAAGVRAVPVTTAYAPSRPASQGKLPLHCTVTSWNAGIRLVCRKCSCKSRAITVHPGLSFDRGPSSRFKSRYPFGLGKSTGCGHHHVDPARGHLASHSLIDGFDLTVATNNGVSVLASTESESLAFGMIRGH